MDLYPILLPWLTEPSGSWLAEPTATDITSSHKKERRGEQWRKEAAGAHGAASGREKALTISASCLRHTDWYRRVRLLSCWRLMVALHSLVWKVLLWTLALMPVSLRSVSRLFSTEWCFFLFRRTSHAIGCSWCVHGLSDKLQLLIALSLSVFHTMLYFSRYSSCENTRK